MNLNQNRRQRVEENRKEQIKGIVAFPVDALCKAVLDKIASRDISRNLISMQIDGPQNTSN